MDRMVSIMKLLREYLCRDIQKYYFQTTDADEQEYLYVVSNYIGYYHYKAWICKWCFYGINTLKLILLASVMVMKVLDAQKDISVYAVAVSAISLAIEGIISLYHLQEKWFLYRNTNNLLMSEVRYFATSKGKYEEEDKRFQHFVNSVESIIGEEARKWHETVSEKNKEKQQETDEKNEEDH